jgi:hypothetical protein
MLIFRRATARFAAEQVEARVSVLPLKKNVKDGHPKGSQSLLSWKVGQSRMNGINQGHPPDDIKQLVYSLRLVSRARIRLARPQLPPTGRSGAWWCSHIRRQLHKRGISGSPGRGRRHAARRTDAGKISAGVALGMVWSYRFCGPWRRSQGRSQPTP